MNLNLQNKNNVQKMSIDSLYTDLLITGRNGYGKTNLKLDIYSQLTKYNHGFTLIDKRGDESNKLIQNIPEDRQKDVINIKNPNTGFNILNCFIDESHSHYKNSIGNMADDLTKRIDKYCPLNPKLANIIHTLLIELISSDNTYTITDFIDLLEHKSKREKFVEKRDLDNVFINRIKNQNQSSFEPISKHVQTWISEPEVEQFISDTSNNINIHEAIKNNKIIILDTSDIINRDSKKLISEFFLNRLWQSIQTDVAIENNSHFLFINDYNDNYDIDIIRDILSHSRQYKLGVCISLKNFYQLPNNTKNLLRTINNTISFNCSIHPQNISHISNIHNKTIYEIKNLNKYEFISSFN